MPSLDIDKLEKELKRRLASTTRAMYAAFLVMTGT